MALATPADSLSTGELSSPRIRRLGIILGLPLVDGVFVTLVLAGILETITGIILTGLVVFGGSAAAAIVLADFGPQPEDQLRGVLLLGGIIIPIAGIQAAIAPSLAFVLDVALLERFAVLVLVVLAIELASQEDRAWLPRPGWIVLLGLLASVRINGGIVWGVDQGLLLRGTLAATIGVGIIAILVLVGPRVRAYVEITWLRNGGATSLLALALSIVTPIPEIGAILILGCALIGARVATTSTSHSECAPD